MELSVASWIRVLFGLVLLLSSVSRADTGGKYFSEGGGLPPAADSTHDKPHGITPRKGALNSTDTDNSRGPSDLKTAVTEEPRNDQVNVTSNTLGDPSQQNSTSSGLPAKLLPISSLNTSEHSANKPALSTLTISTDDATIPPINISTTSSPKRKSKPGLTFDVEDLPRDKNGKVIVNKENLVGSGPSFDYVVPIVIAMLAVPFIAVIGAFLYKKSCDFWERRHYRRMDFLVDGMYND